MANIQNNTNSYNPDELHIEVILQRIFNEKDPTAHRAAIWELFNCTGDWELYEKVSEFGGERGIAAYFQNIMDYLEAPEECTDSAGDLPAIPIENREQIQDLYSTPLACLRRGDWAGAHG